MPGTENSERIAIVGVGGIFPGAPDLDTFWQNIAGGVDAGRHVPPGRWYLSPEKAYAPWPPRPDRVYSTWGCFIEGFEFDPSGLNIDHNLLARLDPMFHLGLHAARAAYRDAKQLAGTDHARVGVILGNIALPTESTSAICRDILGRTFVEKLIDAAASSPSAKNLSDPKIVDRLKSSLKRSDWDPLNRFAAGLPSSLIAMGLGLNGVAFTLDAACASSLYSLKFAAEELLAHRADAMLAGGMSRPDCQYTQMGFAQLQALSRLGRCAPLSAEADGLVVGEGAGVFVLKRLSDAIAHGDHVYGVIAGIGLSNDRGANLLAPHSEGQLRAMRSAYDVAGWKPSDVDLIECHATGTPVGDGVEIASLHQLWKRESSRPHQCVIGGVKSNVGHLLTGAGAAGLMKVLYALRHQTLPPTANFQEPAEQLTAPDSPFRVLSQAEPWLRRASSDGQQIPRRATINAFGFGGINAHVLIEEWNGCASAVSAHHIPGHGGQPLALDTQHASVAIVGIEAQNYTGDTRQSILEDYFQGELPPEVKLNWWGVEESNWFRRERIADSQGEIPDGRATPEPLASPEVRLPLGQFRIPPLEMQDMLPQQQLMLKVAYGALRDAELPRMSTQPETSSPAVAAGTSSDGSPIPDDLANRTGVFIGIELDPNTTNFHFRWSIEQDAKRWASMLGLDLTPEEFANWVLLLKDAASPPLTANRVMGNLGGIVASRLAREFDVGGPSFTVSCGRGSDVVAMNLAVRALQRGELDRAIVGGVEIAIDPRWNAFPQSPGVEANDRPATIGGPAGLPAGHCRTVAEAIVLKRTSDALRDQSRIYASIREGTPSSTRCAASTVLEEWGFSQDGNSGIVGQLMAAPLYVYHGLNPWARMQDSPASSDWSVGALAPFLPRPKTDRLQITIRPRPNSAAWPLMIEAADVPETPLITIERRRPIGELPFGLFVIDGDSSDELLRKLIALDQLCDMNQSIEQMAIRWFRASIPSQDRRLALVLMATSANDLRDAIVRGRERLQGVESSGSLAKQVYYSPHPLTMAGRVAFVFPGSGNAFHRMGRTLLSVFPEVLRRQQDENDDLPEQLKIASYWWGPRRPDVDHKSMIFAQVAIGTAICDLLALFGVRPSASIGYSLGESAAFFGLRAWTDRDEMLQRMQQSTLFGSDLVDPFDAARRAWNIPEAEPVPWVSGVVDRSAADVRAAIDRMRHDYGRERLYLLIVNTPRQCVIGGDRSQVEALVQDLNANFVPLASPSTVHCDVLRQVEVAYRELHLMQTALPVVEMEQGTKAIDFYSTAWGRKYDLSRQNAAEAIVAQAVNTIDFPRVIEQAYVDGVRLFVEIGPGSSCIKMVDETLGERPHLTQAALPMTSRPVEAFFGLLAALIAERVPVDLSYLYGQSPPAPQTQTPPAREVVTRIGGLPFQIPAPLDGWRFLDRPLDLPPSADAVSPDTTATAVAAVTVRNGQAPVDRPASDEVTIHNDDILQDDSPDDHAANATSQSSSPQFTLPLSLWNQFQLMNDQRTQAHETFLRLSARYQQLAAEHLGRLARAGVDVAQSPEQSRDPVAAANASTAVANASQQVQMEPPVIPIDPPTSLSREQCMEFAIGKIGNVLGQKFAEIDKHPTRVRLPDEPLMLVDRILTIEGEPLSMTSGRVVTEHDIHAGAWYLDCGRIPTCIAVESGQADLFLSGWLGIDFETKGLACYRLLDAVVTFHDALPTAGKIINYDIRVLHFFRQGSTYLFRFEFDATVDGKPLLTMREGCAGFFTDAELAGGKGIIHTALDKRPRPGKRPANWNDPVPMASESYDDRQLLALRHGDLASCFGPAFAGLPLKNPVTLPGLPIRQGETRSRMWLIDRVLKVDPVGGKFGMGTILGELDIHPDDWFLTCHFCDDQVMPGTLMYECCLHTLRIYLLRMGWIGEAGEIVYEPIPAVRSRLKCRGQVLAETKKVWYEVTLKEIGYGSPQSGDASAYCLADALMYADGKPIVEITDMSVRLTGLTQSAVERLWQRGQQRPATAVSLPQYDRRPAIFDTDRITAFAIGKPSDAFGDRYLPFDEERKIARLPGPPFQFLDRVVSIQNCQAWVLQAGGEIVAQYDVPPDAWYFASNRQQTMPFAVLLETALQPCGWLAGYLGSALTSDTDLSFRNLGGTATQYREVTPHSGTLTTTVKLTRVSNSAGMIIQHYDFDLRCNGEPVYVGNTYFGFFSKAALSNQIGIREAAPYQPTAEELAVAKRGPYPQLAPFPDDQFRMIQTIECLSPNGGPYGKGCVVGTMPVDPSAWFFKAHFYQDPVVPGSLGLESFWQLLKVYAANRWHLGSDTQFEIPSLAVPCGAPTPAKHEWVYRGQVVPKDALVTVTAVVSDVDDAARTVTAEGYLSVDGRVIYQMKQFKMTCRT